MDDGPSLLDLVQQADRICPSTLPPDATPPTDEELAALYSWLDDRQDNDEPTTDLET